MALPIVGIVVSPRLLMSPFFLRRIGRLIVGFDSVYSKIHGFQHVIPFDYTLEPSILFAIKFNLIYLYCFLLHFYLPPLLEI